jgi:beta-glucanase (GH16 family)
MRAALGDHGRFPLQPRRLVWLLALCLITAAALASVPGTAAAATTDCGSTQIPDPSGGYWTCTFGDDFSGTSLNPANWQALTTATSGFSQAGECYVNDPAHVQVGGGDLTLTATRSARAQRCVGAWSTRYQSGMVVSKDLFSQAYGRFEARVKFPQGTGFQSGYWMWPQDMAYGSSSGEIDVAEYYGAYPSLVFPHTHIKDASGADHGQGAYCNVTDPSGTFHTYAVEWLPTSIKFIYDGATCLNITSWDPPAPLVFPQPFDQPFFMILQLALGYGANAPNLRSRFPAQYVIDYVRAWS